MEKDSDLKCENVNEKILNLSEIYHLGIKHVAIHKTWNAVTFKFRSPTGYIQFFLVLYADLFQSDKGRVYYQYKFNGNNTFPIVY